MLIRRARRTRAGILLVSSSDWEAIAEMHGRMAVFRGVENGVNLVRRTRQGTSLASDYQPGCWATRATYSSPPTTP
jgi:apolipoprotein N-acyltransferase